jgi:quercetin dioxygenase-like cupin family protein
MAADHFHAVGPGDGEAIWFLQTRMTVKASGAESGGAFSLIEVHYPPAFSPPSHIHHREDESFYVLDGDVTFSCGERVWLARPGAFVVLPRGIEHGFTVSADTPARMLQMSSAPGLERFFRDAGRAPSTSGLPPNAAPDVDRLMAAAKRYGIEILGRAAS